MADLDGVAAFPPSLISLGRAMKTQFTSNDARTERLDVDVDEVLT